MRSTLSQKFIEEMFAESSGEVVVVLLTFSHPSLSSDIRVSSDNATLLDYETQLRGTISNGRQYNFIPFTITLPEDGDDAGQVIDVIMDGVGREMTPLLRSTTTPATVRVQFVLASAPNRVEIDYPLFELVSAEVKADQVTLSLAVDVLRNEPFPADNFTPSTFGGLWATT